MSDGPRVFRDGILVRLTRAHLEDGSLARLARELTDLALEYGRQRWYLDCAGVELLTSRVLAQLLLLDEKLRDAGGQLSLCNLSPLLYQFLRATRLTQILDVSIVSGHP